MECHYEILGVPKTATTDEIKRAYKRLALIYHPDKGSDGNMFQKISNSYQILIDPVKRKEYDNKNFDFIFKFFDIFANIIRNVNKNVPTSSVHIPPTVITINISLEDLYFSRIKKLIIKVNKFGTIQSKPYYLSLLNYKSSYIFLKEGDNDGDLEIKLNIKTNDIKIDQIVCPYDLYIERDISLYDYFYGNTFEFKHVDGNWLHCTIKKLNTYVYQNKGLPYYDKDCGILRGKLYVFFRLNLDDYDLSNPDIKPFMQKHLSK